MVVSERAVILVSDAAQPHPKRSHGLCLPLGPIRKAISFMVSMGPGSGPSFSEPRFISPPNHGGGIDGHAGASEIK